MKEKIEERLNDRGQVGIGTLIVFIAMVLVAAIAAGVLINTAGFLQTKSEQTGEESSAQVTNRITAVSSVGNVAKVDLNDDGSKDSEVVNSVDITVMRSSGSDDIDLKGATIEYVGPSGSTNLQYGSSATASEFSVFAFKDEDESKPVLSSKEDRFLITLDTSAIEDNGEGLTEGQSVEVRITTSSGSVTYVSLRVPESLSGEEAVSL
jgi:flagellin FlaA/flagellin FlaB